MRTITTNLVNLETAHDPVGPVLHIRGQSLEEEEEELLLTFYVSGPAATSIHQELWRVFRIAVEIELCLGVHFGRLRKIGFEKMRIGRDYPPPMPPAFENEDDYEKILYISQTSIPTSQACCWPNSGYVDPIQELSREIEEDFSQ